VTVKDGYRGTKHGNLLTYLLTYLFTY